MFFMSNKKIDLCSQLSDLQTWTRASFAITSIYFRVELEGRKTEFLEF